MNVLKPRSHLANHNVPRNGKQPIRAHNPVEPCSRWKAWAKSAGKVANPGLGKNLNSSLPFGQAALKFCSPWASLSLHLVGRRLSQTFGQGPSKNKSYLPCRKIYLSRTTGQYLFLRLESNCSYIVVDHRSSNHHLTH